MSKILFYVSTKAQQREFLTLRYDNLPVIEYASRFVELSRFVLEYVATECMMMLSFEEGLTLNIRNKLARQPIQSSREYICVLPKLNE